MMNGGIGRSLRQGLLVFIAALSPMPLMAFERVDDSASPRSIVSPQVVLSEKGARLEDSLDASTAIVRYGRVEYRLAMGRYMGREIRLYYAVPMNIPGLRSPGNLRVHWQGYGVADGSARPGDRALVWTGAVREPWMNVALDLTFDLDLREFDLPSRAGVGFESYFEVELLK